MKYLKVGKIVNTHGIKGELRLLSDFKYKEKIFVSNFNIYIGRDKIHEVINTYRVHKKFDMITLKRYTNINDVLKYKGMFVFINKDELVLNKDEYLDEELIDFKVIYANKDTLRVRDVINYPNNKTLKVECNNKYFLIPFALIEKIDLDRKEIKVLEVKGLIDED